MGGGAEEGRVKKEEEWNRDDQTGRGEREKMREVKNRKREVDEGETE